MVGHVHIVLLGLLRAVGAGVNSVALGGTSGGNGGAGNIVMLAIYGILGLSGRGGHIVGDLGAKQQESQLGIVNEDITGTGDGLNRVVAAQLPGINGVFFHPLEQNVQALDDTIRTPHSFQSTVCVGAVAAPADVDVECDTGHIAVQIMLAVALGIWIVEAGTLTVSLVATAAVHGGGGGTEHHDVRFADGFTVSGILTVGPGVLTVPSGAFVPGGTKGVAGIEAGNSLGITAVLTVSVLIPISGISVLG